MLLSYIFCAICIQIITTVKARTDNLELKFVQILFRHGDRAPITLYPNDPNPETVWPEGLSKLTLLGRKQHYALGKFLRSYYKNFMTSSPLEVNVTSSDVDRCLKSAETNLASFYAPSDKWKFDKDVNWQPIPINYLPERSDRFLETDSDCPMAEEETKRVFNSPAAKEFIAKHKEMFDNLTYYSGMPITDWRSSCYFYDTLFIEKRYNLTIPKWAEPYWDELEEVADLSFYLSFNSTLLHRLRAGPLLQRIIKNMNDKIAGNVPLLKFQIYSSHDTNVAVVLDALNLYNMRKPPYCATLLFELYEDSNNSTFLHLLYLNSSTPESGSQVPHVLVLDGCTEYCPLEYFINYTKPFMVDDWEKECQFSKSFVEKMKDEEMTIGAVFFLVVLIMITMSVVAVWKMYRQKRDKYAYHLMSMDS